jgi:hypothetical protein
MFGTHHIVVIPVKSIFKNEISVPAVTGAVNTDREQSGTNVSDRYR